MPVTFIDDDLLLRSKLYDCLLFVTSYVREQKFNRILMDGGSSINIMTKSTMHDLGIIVEELLTSWAMIQGFNLKG